MMRTVFWDVTPRILVQVCRCFGVIYRLCLESWKQAVEVTDSNQAVSRAEKVRLLGATAVVSQTQFLLPWRPGYHTVIKSPAYTIETAHKLCIFRQSTTSSCVFIAIYSVPLGHSLSSHHFRSALSLNPHLQDNNCKYLRGFVRTSSMKINNIEVIP